MSVDLSKLPAPAVVEALDFETILAEMVADLKARDVTFDATVESDPAYKVLETAAYRELGLRQRVNDAAKALMLAFATGTDLDQLAALQDVQRLLLSAGDPDAVPPIDPTYEKDDRLLERTQLAPESQSTAGPTGAYEFHALSADAKVLDVDIASPAAVQVVVTVLSTEGDGVPDQALLDAVEAALADDKKVRPLTDQVTVQAATIIDYSIDATLIVYPGPDSEVIRQAAYDAAVAYAAACHRLGYDVTFSGLYAALHKPGVQKVVLTSPAADKVAANNEATYCTGVVVAIGGVDE
jgi:phage-related baseplate assembly protein